ncbi:Rgg family transcriptional regulator [Lactococcus taiwanensis]|uniref:helix-turn-helix domain-containing protein n=1 Tax=Lactococcus taiwanensis TaxID=1151742 RepID=UPI001903466D|nr:Rgg/GadR/MutR family transcriptional regulator [Lactococcus taiwanensis]
MIYKKYGNTFRMLRNQKQLPLSDFSSIAPSKSTISKFERGETMMGFDKVLASLQIMGVSLEEFEFLLDGFTLDDAQFLMQEIEEAIIEQNNNRLQELYKIAKNSELQYIALTAKAYFSSLDEKEIESITDYFFSLEAWLTSDLWILSFTIRHLDIHDSLHILDKLIADKDSIVRSTTYSYYLVKVICNAALRLIKLGYKDYAKYLLDHIQNSSMINISTHNFMFLQNLYNLTIGCWIFNFQERSEGKNKIEKALRIFEETGNYNLSNYYKQLIQSLLLPRQLHISTKKVSQ